MSELATYDFGGARVSVRFEAPGFSEWLHEVLHPAFTRVDADREAVTVIARRGGTQARDRFAAATELLPCFTFDREVVSLPAKRNGTTIEVFDDKYGARYVVRLESVPCVEVHADGPWPRTRAALLRVVRELAVAKCLANERSVRLHASGVERDGAVVLFAGPKGAGKTTLLAHLAWAARAAVVTNDCALVTRSTSAEWEVRPVPISISVRPDTLRRLPDLFHGVADVETLMQYTVEEAARAADQFGIVTTPRRLRLSPAAFADSVQSRLSPGGRLVTVAMLAADDVTVGCALHPLSVDEAERRIPSVRYGLDGAAPRTVFAELVDPDGAGSAEAGVVARLATEVRCLDVGIGPDLFDGRAAACDLLDRLVTP